MDRRSLIGHEVKIRILDKLAAILDLENCTIERQQSVSHECDYCENLATEKHTYLLHDARRNPASSGYGKDDISWCSDYEQFVCDEHKNTEESVPDGMRWCSMFKNGKRFAHMFQYKRKTDVTDELRALFDKITGTVRERDAA